MRLLILGVSALSLSACSVGGVGFGHGSGGYGYSTNMAQPSVWTGNTAHYGHGDPSAGYGQVPCGFDPCMAPAPAPVVPCGFDPCATPTMPYAPITPASQPVSYMPPPLSVQSGCVQDPCASTYAVSPYAHGTPAPSYGHKAGFSGLRGYGGGFATRHQPHVYGTLGAVYYDPDQPYVGAQARLGYQSATPFGAELEASIGVIGDSDSFPSINGSTVPGTIEDDIDSSIAVFGTARLPLAQGFSTHARLGYHNTKTSRDFEFDNGEVFESSDTLVGLAYGAGLQYDLTPVDGLRLDYTRYEGATDLDSLSFAYLRRF